jgi:hypothetical protein
VGNTADTQSSFGSFGPTGRHDIEVVMARYPPLSDSCPSWSEDFPLRRRGSGQVLAFSEGFRPRYHSWKRCLRLMETLRWGALLQLCEANTVDITALVAGSVGSEIFLSIFCSSMAQLVALVF